MPTKSRRTAPLTVDPTIDELDRRILDELQADARVSVAELGRRVSLSASAVAERVHRLEQAGVILGYRAVIDPAKVGRPLGVVIRSRPAPGRLQAVAEIARRTPEVVACHRVTGDDCYVMVAYVRDVGHLEEVIDAFAAQGQTTTAVMQSAPVPRRGIPLADAPG